MMPALKRIGIYGGTFDPVHHGHLILARAAREQLELEQVLFLPAAISPHKLTEQPAPAEARVEMLRAALAGEPGFALDERELRRPPPSRTIDTIEEFRQQDAASELFYLIGGDQLPRLESWHRFEELQRLVQFVLLERGALPAESPYPVVHRVIDISSTEIRNRVASGRSVRYLVPRAVEEIILRRALYQEPRK